MNIRNILNLSVPFRRNQNVIAVHQKVARQIQIAIPNRIHHIFVGIKTENTSRSLGRTAIGHKNRIIFDSDSPEAAFSRSDEIRDDFIPGDTDF